jgi:hypothetical protein
MKKRMMCSPFLLLLLLGTQTPLAYSEMMAAQMGMMGEQKLMLTAGPAGKGAKGEAVVKDSGTDQKEVSLMMTGLKPNSVYTVELTNMKPRMEMLSIGEGDYSFKSDDQGNGHYTARVPADELSRWQRLEVYFHPDGNPKSMKKMEIALSADLMMVEKKEMIEKDKTKDMKEMQDTGGMMK